MRQKNYEAPVTPSEPFIEKNEVEQITQFLEQQGMRVDQILMISAHEKGLTLEMVRQIYAQNQNRYTDFLEKINQTDATRAQALFNAFILDYERHQRNTHVAPYASYKE